MGDPLDDPRAEYERLLKELDILSQQGKGETPEADLIRDQMDVPWHQMSLDDQEEMRKLSVDLYAKWETHWG